MPVQPLHGVVERAGPDLVVVAAAHIGDSLSSSLMAAAQLNDGGESVFVAMGVDADNVVDTVGQHGQPETRGGQAPH